MNRRHVFGGEHSGPIYGSSHIWAPYMKTRQPLTNSHTILPLMHPPPAPPQNPSPCPQKKISQEYLATSSSRKLLYYSFEKLSSPI